MKKKKRKTSFINQRLPYLVFGLKPIIKKRNVGCLAIKGVK